MKIYSMHIERFQDILPLVEQPSRYLGNEVNTTHKDSRGVKLQVALAFPDLYEIGTSHFGMQIIYHLLNCDPEISAERVFCPATDLASHLRSSDLALSSLESRTPLCDFDIIGFSLLYELNYTNVLAMLDLSKIPFLAAERDIEHPLIIAGGPCTCNPEPVAELFDAMVIGDGENVVVEMARTWLQTPPRDNEARQELLQRWSQIEGVYVPSFFKATYSSDGFQRLEPKTEGYGSVKRAIFAEIEKAPFPDRPIIPYARPIHDRLRLEISRGCTRGCRFCQAGIIYRPVRERSPHGLVDLTEKCLAATGYEDISLLSLSTGDYENISWLLQQIMTRCAHTHTAVSLPSLRAGTLTPELMALVRQVRKTGFTIAPEAGSQRLRDLINKNITEADIVSTVEDAFAMGWQVIKLYFMIGLPTETQEDLKAIVDLVKRLRKIQGPRGRAGKINVSITPFIPKPHTPFQWETQISLEEASERLKWLHEQLKIGGVQFKWQNPKASLLEGLWARGDRRLIRLLEAAYRKGCQFDGWSDKFQFSVWQEAILETGVDMDFFTRRNRALDEPLPWDHIHSGVNKSYLVEEREDALSGRLTPDCRQGLKACNHCGVCDFQHIQPHLFERVQPDSTPSRMSPAKRPAKEAPVLQVTYRKTGQARYFGHLEMVNIFLRALRRLNIAVKYSEGFHPLPKVAFSDPLPVGMESLREHFYITLVEAQDPQELVSALNTQLPAGLVVLDCCQAPSKKQRSAGPAWIGYTVSSPKKIFTAQKLSQYMTATEVFYERTNRKGRSQKIDLKQAIEKIEASDERYLDLVLKMKPGMTLRPREVMATIFNLSENDLKQVRIVKNA